MGEQLGVWERNREKKREGQGRGGSGKERGSAKGH